MSTQAQTWTFKGSEGDFELKDPHLTSYLYFPLVNEAGMMSSITPSLHGDIKSGHNTFLSEPVSAESLHNSRAARNFWVHVQEFGPWSCTGNSAIQQASRFDQETEGGDKVTLEAGLLWHKVVRENARIGVRAETVSFVPAGPDRVELMKVTLTNTGNRKRTLTPTAAVPLYARSADDLRDHRHVTSLLHRIYTSEGGIEVQPSLSFDERGHRVNKTAYSVLGGEGDGGKPSGFFPIAERFTGEGGSYDWPEAVVRNETPHCGPGEVLEGLEAVGGIRFAEAALQPGESKSYIVAMAITDDRMDEESLWKTYMSEASFDHLLGACKAYWKEKVDAVRFHSANKEFDLWMRWVTLQPILRRLFGNSFMPHHDYGRGGRGWRDLWQDCLALMIMEPEEVRQLLSGNFAGVRIDGSNATIIGRLPGEFVADRNNIPRVWMDHGAWPFLTVLLYLNQSGDLDFLLQEQTYFRDAFVNRCRERDASWTPESGNLLKTTNGEIYRGTILEHMLLQHLTPFYLVGEHNHMRLEGADWNDGLDMAADRGESVAFTAFYAGNLRDLASLLRELERRTGTARVELAEEMLVLLDSLGEPADYDSVSAKHGVLDRYFERITGGVSGRKAAVSLVSLAEDLERKASWTENHIRASEWVASEGGSSWFNGYYNNDGERVEGDHPEGVRMTLTGQVFPIMSGVATEEQISSVIQAVDRHLLDEEIGYRLNSRFGGVQQNLGRAFGFAFGHKENGAMFSHMTVMYANALYKRGFVKEGKAVLDSIHSLCADFPKSRIYPGIPEYINEQGRGMYHYLTGSASWLLLTELMEVYGVKGDMGDLLLQPKLAGEQFDEAGKASVVTRFAGRRLRIVYINEGRKEYGERQAGACLLNGKPARVEPAAGGCLLSRALIESLPEEGVHELSLELL
ncbi:cellobiose phosphorylase [Paenibacillus sp. HN-1]|uniref:GH36-type glycosyl hydrolase domain-containing protein n=1 Tax=Paenibacillus TaxID=44249 RepID=UPI001CA7F775|nr:MULTISPECIES: cellobiose phosphorylase [Paenibacillus]MBY9079136.1 cellobiose phosphorylase [Paenibacillus sp. CGMCC 1.18879]MBY9086914.1 cellobiose phosphorylase [Paenibacillus sinensis]